MSEESTSPSSHIGGTLVALVLAPIVFVVFGGILGAIHGLAQSLITDSSQWWIFTTVGVVQAIGGTYGAKIACDAILRSYSGRSVFIELVGITGSLTALSLYLLPWTGRQVSLLIQFGFIAYFSWLAFWKGEEI